MNSPPDRAPPACTQSNPGSQPSPVTAAPAGNHRLLSHELMRGQSAVVIEHNGNTYRLQTTRQGKLILTK